MRLLTRKEINQIPDLKPMIDGVLDKGTVAMLAAQPGAGKSFLALDWACCYATRKDWQSRTTSNTVGAGTNIHAGGKVLYIAAEGARGMKARLNAWERTWNTQVPDSRFRLLAQPVNLGNMTEVMALCKLIKEEGPFGLLVIDTLARCTMGLEENNATEMGRVIQAAYMIRTAMGVDGTVLLIHHQGKSGAVRGSSALLGGVDLMLTLSNDHGHLVLEDEKRKDGKPMGEVTLKLEESHGSMVISSDANDTTHNNPLVPLMQQVQQLLPMSRSELKMAIDMQDRLIYSCLAHGINAGYILATNDKNPRYSLSSKGLEYKLM